MNDVSIKRPVIKGAMRIGGKHVGADGEELHEGDRSWKVTEAALLGPGGETLPRLPGHLAYWFAWVGNFDAATLGGD